MTTTHWLGCGSPAGPSPARRLRWLMRADAKEESLSIPQRIREAVDARDGESCRMCGRYLGERRALHHVIFGGDERGMGGRRQHRVEEIITLCWLPGDGDCHNKAHSDKHHWQDLLLELCRRPGVTAYQLERWSRNRLRRLGRKPGHGTGE